MLVVSSDGQSDAMWKREQEVVGCNQTTIYRETKLISLRYWFQCVLLIFESGRERVAWYPPGPRDCQSWLS